MRIQHTQRGNVALVSLRGNLLGGPDSDRIHDLIQVILDGGSREVVFDLSEVRRITSCGVGILITANQALARRGGRLCVVEVSRQIDQVFYVIQLHKHIPVHDSVESALEALQRVEPSTRRAMVSLGDAGRAPQV